MRIELKTHQQSCRALPRLTNREHHISGVQYHQSAANPLPVRRDKSTMTRRRAAVPTSLFSSQFAIVA